MARGLPYSAIPIDLPDGRRVLRGVVVSAGDAASADGERARNAALDATVREQAGDRTAGTISTFDNRAVGSLNRVNAAGRIPLAAVSPARGGTMGLQAAQAGGVLGVNPRGPAGAPLVGDDDLFRARQTLMMARGLNLGRNYSDDALNRASPEQLIAEAGLVPQRLSFLDQQRRQQADVARRAAFGSEGGIGDGSLNGQGLKVSRSGAAAVPRGIYGDANPGQTMRVDGGSVTFGNPANLPQGSIAVNGQMVEFPDVEAPVQQVAQTGRGYDPNDFLDTGGDAIGVNPTDRVETFVSGAVRRFLSAGGDPSGVPQIAQSARIMADPTGELTAQRQMDLQDARARDAFERDRAAEAFRASLAEQASLRSEARQVSADLRTAETAAAKFKLFDPIVDGEAATQAALKAISYSGRVFTGGDSLADLADPQAALAVLDARGDAAGRQQFLKAYASARAQIEQDNLAQNPEAAQALQTRDFLRGRAQELGLVPGSGGGAGGRNFTTEPAGGGGETGRAQPQAMAAPAETAQPRRVAKTSGVAKGKKGRATLTPDDLAAFKALVAPVVAPQAAAPHPWAGYGGALGLANSAFGQVNRAPAAVGRAMDAVNAAGSSVASRAKLMWLDATEPVRMGAGWLVGGDRRVADQQRMLDASRLRSIQNVNALAPITGAERFDPAGAGRNAFAAAADAILDKSRRARERMIANTPR